MAAVGVPSTARAATVVSGTDCVGKYQVCNGWATVRAAPGETNRIALSDTQPAGGVIVHDGGAPLTAGAGCVARDAATVVCTTAAGIGAVDVRAGDGADVVDASALHFGVAWLDGGSGDDRLVALGIERVLVGGLGADVLVGDTDAQARYDDRRAGVRVDLAAGVATRRGGERDRIEGVGAVLGSSGDDVLIGDGRTNALAGGPGDDRIAGGAGRDGIAGGTGADRIDGGAGDDELSPSAPEVGAGGADRARDRVACGAGRDRATGLAVPDLVVSGCELVDVDNAIFVHPLRLAAVPRTPGGPFLGGTLELCTCTLRVVVRAVGSGRRVASTRVRLDRPGRRPVSLALDARGQAMLRRRGALRIRVSFDVGDTPVGFDTVLRRR